MFSAPDKTFKAAANYFADSLTDAHRKHDVHQWNAMAGLYHLACALDALQARISKIEADLQRRE